MLELSFNLIYHLFPLLLSLPRSRDVSIQLGSAELQTQNVQLQIRSEQRMVLKLLLFKNDFLSFETFLMLVGQFRVEKTLQEGGLAARNLTLSVWVLYIYHYLLN